MAISSRWQNLTGRFSSRWMRISVGSSWAILSLLNEARQFCEQIIDQLKAKVHRCDNRIVSISQLWVRPIVRGKQHKPTEFGAKINVSLDADGLARVDRHSWDAFHEGNALPDKVQSYCDRFGHYPELVIADSIYGTRNNRAYLKELGIRFAGKALGRPPKKTSANAEQLKADKQRRQKEYRQRIPIEGKFGQ